MSEDENSGMNDNSRIMVVTTNDVPGYEITDIKGEVFGVVSRSRNMFSNIGAGLKTVVGGEIRAYTKLVEENRLEALKRLRESAAQVGGNAVLMSRFDTDTLGGTIAGVVAYGTAAVIKRK
jgi:uncharacterized protein YbjQ (UPF0145 family)